MLKIDFSSLRLRTRLQILSMLMLAGLVVICVISLLRLTDNLLEDRKLKTKNLVEIGIGILAHYHQQSQAGKMSETEAKSAAVAALRGLRYGSNDYFFGFDNNHVYFLMPNKPEFEGQNKADLKDARGTPMIQEMVKVALAGGGYVEYWFPRVGSKEPLPKISYTALFTPWNWILGTGIYIDDIETEYRRSALILGGMSLGLLILLGILSWRIGRGIVREMGGEPGYAAEVTHRIAAGDLTGNIVTSPSASRNSLLTSLGSMQNRLADVFGHIDQTAGSVEQHATTLSRAATEIDHAAEAQSQATASLAATLQEVTVSINEVSALAKQTESASERVCALSGDSVSAIKQALVEIDATALAVGRSSEQVGELVRRSDEVGGIAKVIREIADQTNLLALNAAIEAARAGEQGRGFAVVADEVRKLAERTTKATHEIARVIGQIQDETRQTVSGMEAVTPKIQHGLAKVSAVASMLDTISAEATDSRTRALAVANATREQAAAANEVAKNVEHVAQMTQNTNATMRTNVENATRLQQMAHELRQQVAYFKLA